MRRMNEEGLPQKCWNCVHLEEEEKDALKFMDAGIGMRKGNYYIIIILLMSLFNLISIVY